jgi:hypothetical protein
MERLACGWTPCYRYMHGDRREDPTQAVEVSGELVAVPCEQWFPRQTMYVQGACIAEGALLAIFLMRAIGDYVNWRRIKKGEPRLEE